MVYLWHRPHDFNCGLCRDNPRLKTLKGCTENSKHPHTYPPMDKHYSGDRITIDVCPARFVQGDTIAMVQEYQLADGRLSVTEGAHMPPPYRDAWLKTCAEQAAAKLAAAKGVSNGK